MFKWFVIFLLGVPSIASASDSCMLADEMDAALVDWYGERAVAETQNGDAVLWSNDETGSWTIVRYNLAGLACVLLSGTGVPGDENGTEVLARLSL